MTNPNVLRFELRPGVVLRLEIDSVGYMSLIHEGGYAPTLKALFPNGYTDLTDPGPEPAREVEAGE